MLRIPNGVTIEINRLNTDEAIIFTMTGTDDNGLTTIGDYILHEKLGANNFSAVYQATHTGTKQDVILRLLFNAESVEIQTQFMEQVGQIAMLSHPAVIPVIDFGAVDDIIYIAIPLLSGGSLKARLQARRSSIDPDDPIDVEKLPSPLETSRMLDRIAAGLDYLHGQGITHMHVQPSNIMFDGEGNAYLADTGVAKIFKIVFALKETNAIGTHPYAPPEQWQGEAATPASDQYALACIVYELLTGRQVFQSSSIFKMMTMHLNDFLMPPHHVRPGLPAQLTIVLVRALAKTPEERYSSVTEFAREFHKTVVKARNMPTDFFTFDLNAVEKPASTKHDVVICGAPDAGDAVKQAMQDLESAGLRVWQSEQSPDSIAWKTEIRSAIQQSKQVIAVLTAGAMDAKEVNLCINYAERYEKPMYALWVESEHRHRGAFEQIIDAREDYAAGIAALLKTVQPV